MVNLSKISRVKAPPVAILISGLVVVGLLTAEAGILHYGSELKSYETASAETLKEQKEQLTQNYKDANKKASASQASPNDSPNRYINGSSYAAGANSGGPGGPASSTSSGSSSVHSKISYVKVFLSVNGSPKGSVSLKSTANQCQVLTQAKAQGVISSLVMKYNESLNSYGVYVIDGIGRTDQVYWTYTVNGKPPPLGCSYVTVHGGDSINWRYIN